MDYDLAETAAGQRRLDEYAVGRILSRRLMIDAVVASEYIESGDYSPLKPIYAAYYKANAETLARIWAEYTEIEAFARVWEARNWLNRLQAYYAHNDRREHSAVTHVYTARLWGCAGRALLTLESGETQLTLIFDESPRQCLLGVQSVNGTFVQIITLLASAIFDFPTMTPQ